MAYLSETHGLPKAFHSIQAQLPAALRRAGQKIRRGVVSLQVARMESVLHSMTDTQLSSVGITRADIRSHAQTLVTGQGSRTS